MKPATLPLGDQQIQPLQSLYLDALAGIDPDQPVTDDHPVRTGGGLVMRDMHKQPGTRDTTDGCGHDRGKRLGRQQQLGLPASQPHRGQALGQGRPRRLEHRRRGQRGEGRGAQRHRRVRQHAVDGRSQPRPIQPRSGDQHEVHPDLAGAQIRQCKRSQVGGVSCQRCVMSDSATDHESGALPSSTVRRTYAFSELAGPVAGRVGGLDGQVPRGPEPLGMIALKALIGEPPEIFGSVNRSCGPFVSRNGGNSYRERAWSFVSCLAHSG